MELLQNKEEQLKERIYEKYLEIWDGSDRQKNTLQLRDLILRWSDKYFYKNSTYAYWEEITSSVLRVANQIKEKFPNHNEFIKYLKVTLKNAKAYYYRRKGNKLIHIPKGQFQKIKTIIKYLERLECEKQKQLSEYEKIQYAAEWFNISVEKMKIYFERIANMENISMYNDELLNDEDYLNENTPEANFFSKQQSLERSKKIHEALESVFKKRYKNTKPLIRALFTAKCLNEKTDNGWLDDNFSWINDYLDENTLEFYRINGKSPSNKEIYLWFRPDSRNPHQEVSSHNSKFMREFEKALKERNIKFFL